MEHDKQILPGEEQVVQFYWQETHDPFELKNPSMHVVQVVAFAQVVHKLFPPTIWHPVQVPAPESK